jgi:glycosyltransferase involved in cell wall biosynthesis
MKIGIDARLYSQTGVGRYIRNLISELQILDKENEYYVYLMTQDFDKLHLTNPKWRKKILNFRWHGFLEQIMVPKILYLDSLDLVHFPYFNVPILYFKKYILTIHDLIIDHFDTGKASKLPYLIYKLKRFAYKFTLYFGVARSRFILTISDSTKRELLRHYPIKKDKIIMTYEGVDKKFIRLLKKIKPVKLFNFPYILYVGNAYPHKNLEKLILAFEDIVKKEKVKLVLAGNDDYFFPRIKESVSKSKIANDVVFFGNANDKELINLYTYARCLVFPSLMEGFGLPNIEAVYASCLPVVSDISVFREIWGDIFEYFDPNNEKDMARKILKVLTYSRSKHRVKLTLARKEAAKYIWERTALQIYEVYKLCG